MTDDALIEAMARAIGDELGDEGWEDLTFLAKAALAVARPIIERETRERCAMVAEEAWRRGVYPDDIAAAIRSDAAGRIAALEAENEKLQWELGKALDTLVVHDAVCAENEKLRAALKPFATVASHGYYGGPLVQARIYYECETEERAGKTYIDSAAFRAAAAALKETNND